MVGLFDVAPATETVAVRGKSYVVYGLFIDDLWALSARFPELRKVVEDSKVDVTEIIKLGDKVVTTIIAMGTQTPFSDERTKMAAALGLPAPEGLEELERGVRNLALGEKAKFLTSILKATIGEEGFDPFVELIKAGGLEELTNEFGRLYREALGAMAKVKMGPSPANGSQPPSTSLLPTDTRPPSSLQ